MSENEVRNECEERDMNEERNDRKKKLKTERTVNDHCRRSNANHSNTSSSSDVLNCELNAVYKNIESGVELIATNAKCALPNGTEIINDPFQCYVFNEFIESCEFLNGLRKELNEEVDYHMKNNDLYSFRQSDDFKTLDLPYANAIRNCFLSKVRNFLMKITGFELYEDIVDMTASKYEYKDVLLCHDDRLEGRRIAFILYLTPQWNHSDGGLLELFSADVNQQPLQVTKTIVPKWNKFVCFEVTPISYHNVSEVLSREKCRLTVNGWFRGPNVKEPTPYNEQYLDVTKCGDVNVSEKLFKSWINPLYLKRKTQIEIQQQFTETSEISLQNFLNEEKYDQIASLLRSDQLNWKLTLPPNKRKYEVLNHDEIPEILIELSNVFKSEAMFLTLSNLTGLKLHPLAEEDDDESIEEEENNLPFNPRCHFQIRKWSKGCYTLVHDFDPLVIDETPKLNVTLYFNHDFECDRDSGGFTSYIAKNSDEELLCVEPESNCLSIIYAEGETVSFVKYLNDSFSNIYQDLNVIFQK